MPESQTIELKFSKKWIFWVIGLVVLAILVYQYSQTGSLFPKPPGQLSQSLSERASKAGYKIAYNGISNDTTGRAILAEGKRSEELFPEKFYWTTETNTKLNLTGLPVGMGVFVRLSKIPGSKDYYILLKNPLSETKEGEQFGARIIIDEIKAATKTANLQKTALNVDNLDYGYKNKNISSSQRYGLFANIDKSTLDKIIKPGDILVIYTIPANEVQAKELKALMLMDEKRIPYASSISIRRFGGLDELRKELGNNK